MGSDSRFSQFNDDELQMMVNALFDFGLDSLCFECVNEMKKRKKEEKKKETNNS